MENPTRPNRRRLRFSIRTLLVFTALIAIGLSAYVAYERWTDATYPHRKAFRALHRTVRNGDSIDDVVHALPGIAEADASEMSVFMNMVQKGYVQMPEPNDRLFVYKIEGENFILTIRLQFRDGKLTNYDPAPFARYDDLEISTVVP